MTLSQEIRIAMLAIAQRRPIPAPRPLLIDEADMNQEELAATVGEMKETATMFVQRYAAIHARDVSTEMVDAICRALGDISIDEATAALDRLQAGGITTG